MTALKDNTLAKIQRMNDKLENGFHIDKLKYLTMNSTIPVKQIEISDNKFLQAELWFRNEYENFQQIGLSIVLNISQYSRKNEDSLFSSYGLGHTVTMVSDLNRRNFNEMVKLSKQLTTERIIEMSEEQLALQQRCLAEGIF